LTDSIVVEVKDSRDNPVRFAQVHFLPSAGGKAAPEAVLTNDQGLAKTAWKVANEPGNNVLKAYLMDGNDEEIAGAAILFNATGEGEEKSDTLVYGGKTYKTVKIGEQWWMAENLAYNTSTSISLPPYGNYYTLTDALSVCPSGWHLPSDSDWEQLAKYISDKNGPYQKDEYKWLGVGTHLKSNSGWLAWPPNGTYYGNGTDDYNFNGLPGGSYFLEQDEEDNLFYENSFKGENATWWTSTSFSFSDGDDHFSGYWARGLDAFYFPDPTNPFSLIKDSSLYKIGIEHIFGNFMKLNVRCVKDNE
jgi:uncharacterized protein (TIGR02145 family)